MARDHSDTTKIARMRYIGRGNDARKSHRVGPTKAQPPMPIIEVRNSRSIEECQLMQFTEMIGRLIIITVDLPDGSTAISENAIRAQILRFFSIMSLPPQILHQVELSARRTKSLKCDTPASTK